MAIDARGNHGKPILSLFEFREIQSKLTFQFLEMLPLKSSIYTDRSTDTCEYVNNEIAMTKKLRLFERH